MQSNTLLPWEKPFRWSNTEKIGFTLESERMTHTHTHTERRGRGEQTDVVGVFRLRVQVFPLDHGKDDTEKRC